jgi:NAD-dependent dihydropyrimidine dehydrogenase PreA subunit
VTEKSVFEMLAKHLSRLGMGYPDNEDLIAILEENFSPLEAEVALAIPNTVIPLTPVGLDEIHQSSELSKEDLKNVLEGLASRGMVFSGETEQGETGYALHQVGFGFPQTFFWKGEDTPHARKMAKMLAKYFNRHVTQEVYATDTRSYRYIPVGKSIDVEKQAVYPMHMMEHVIEQAEVLAVGHCPCRTAYALAGKGCDHPTDVCMKFNDMARYVIGRGLAREINKKEALDIIRRSEEEGLVHFVDNTEDGIQHNCNCCGCACWNVGNIRRRKIPRDVLMATYFIRETDEDACTGCGSCEDICPVDAVKMEDDTPIVDNDWCIGCGVCTTVCPSDAVKMILRPDRSEQVHTKTFKELQNLIQKERGIA